MSISLKCYGLLLLLIVIPLAAGSTEPDPIIIRIYTAETILHGQALSGINGATGVNMAAGDNNLQSNAGAIALGREVASQNNLIQKSIANGFTPDRASVSIQDQAFNNSIGWMAVNQVAGQGNAQSNAMSIAAGLKGRALTELTDNSLGQVLSSQQEGLNGNSGNNGGTSRTVGIDGTAFNGARGIIQVNQSAGTGNATSNSFELRMGTGTGR